MFSLDNPTSGPHPVGATTFVVPVRPARVVGTAKIGQQPALQLEEVAFTAYYPAHVEDAAKPKKGLNWLLRPVNQSLRGFVQFGRVSAWLIWPLVYFFGAFIKIPVHINAPLLQPRRDSQDPSEWPLVIFSHGLGGSRTAYSQLCTNIAASGRVVLAIEHRDGTGHAVMSRTWDTSGNPIMKPILYIRENDIIWEPDTAQHDSEDTPLPLRAQQLAFRHHEIYIAYTAFQELVTKGHGKHSLETVDNTPIDWASWSADAGSKSPPIRCDRDVTLSGHSFGGCTVFSLLSTKPPLKDYDRLPVTKALIFDPWLEPLPIPGPSPFSSLAHEVESVASASSTVSLKENPMSAASADNEAPSTKNPVAEQGRPNTANLELLVINSEKFTIWKDHFARLQGVVQEWAPQGQRLLTVVRSQHPSFSDFLVLPVIRTKSARTLMGTIVALSVAFLDNRLREELRVRKTREMEVRVVGKKPDGKPKRELLGEVGDVIVH
ncbi:hypothetical protein HGRIS_009420 [Hohenbuehelia grisea]|uniref:1-alkyl-2-acetylglycerophosphocholine esterase n=1 Tax=Hohenbuehelia grisea TaxID=104357 RepID=A0ABR3J1L2_9AGAR